MNRLQSTLAQTYAIGRVNIELEADKVIKRIYKTQLPTAPANEDVAKFMLDRGYAFRQNGPLLALTYKGKQHAREIGA